MDLWYVFKTWLRSQRPKCFFDRWIDVRWSSEKGMQYSIVLFATWCWTLPNYGIHYSVVHTTTSTRHISEQIVVHGRAAREKEKGRERVCERDRKESCTIPIQLNLDESTFNRIEMSSSVLLCVFLLFFQFFFLFSLPSDALATLQNRTNAPIS